MGGLSGMITNIGARRIRHGFEIVLDAAPRKAAILALLAIALGLAPVVAAWLLKLVLDVLATEREWTVLLGLGVALAAAGIAAGVGARLNQYLLYPGTSAARWVTCGRMVAGGG